jgi:rRNA-processing protein FCF1
MSPSGSTPVRVVVSDTNILISFIHIDLLNLLGKLPPYNFVVPEEVIKEVRRLQQAQAPQTAGSSGLLLEVELRDPAELKVYAIPKGSRRK